MAERICSIDGCERPAKVRGWCQVHYMRWYRNGDPEVGLRFNSPPPEDGLCTIDGCDKPAKARGWCDTHYMRWLHHGDPNYVKYSLTGWFGPDHPGWLGDDVGIRGAHKRVYRDCGPASDYVCSKCGQPAKEWAYDHRDLNEKRSPKGYPYSLDIAHYTPLCWPCHRQMDLEFRPRKKRTYCQRGHEFSDANTYWTPDGRRKCRACAKLRQARYERKRKRVS